MAKKLVDLFCFKFESSSPCIDNQFAIYITQNPVFHDRSSHIEVDCHLAHDTMVKKLICASFTPSLASFTPLLVIDN